MSKETSAISKNVEDYVANEEKLKNLGGGKNITDMSDDEAEAFLAERKKLKTANEALKNEDHSEALTENEKADAYGEADTMNKDLDAAKAKAEEAANLKAEALARAEQAEQDQMARQKEIDEATALAERIKNGTSIREVPDIVKTEGRENAEHSESAGEDLGTKPVEERLETPKTEMFEKYGSTMRKAADELVSVMRDWEAKRAEQIASEFNSPEWKRLTDEERALNDRRNQLREDAMWGAKVIKFRSQSSGESWSQHSDYQSKELDAYQKAAMSDPYTVMRLAEASQLGQGYGENEGIGKIDQKLRSNPEFMAKVLENISKSGAESFWAHVAGEANNKELYLAAIKKNALNYQWGSKEWKSDPEVQQVALESGLIPTYLYKG